MYGVLQELNFRALQHGSRLLIMAWLLGAGTMAGASINDSAAGPIIYLADFFPQSDSGIIHWSYNRGRPDWTVVRISDAGGKQLAEVRRPQNSWNPQTLPRGSSVTLTPVRSDGQVGKKVIVELSGARAYEVKSLGRIGISKSNGLACFIDKATGEVFHPQGINYVPLAQQGADHSIFQAATSTSLADYDPLAAESMFRLLAANHYNTVRIFLAGRNPDVTPGLAGEKGTVGLYVPYLNNFADFLSRAARHGIYVIVNFCDLDVPHNDYFAHLLGNDMAPNRVILTREGLKAHLEQAVSTLTYLKQCNPDLLKVLLGVELNNEVSLRLLRWPFDQTGFVTLANGRSYNMANPQERQKAAEEGMLYYYQCMVPAIKAVDPELLVCEGLFTAAAVGRDYDNGKAFIPEAGAEWDRADGFRLPPSLSLLAESPLDFLDIHFYAPDTPISRLATDMANGLKSLQYDAAVKSGLLQKKPLLLGEFGSFSSGPDTDMKKAAERMRKIRKLACNTYEFTGFLIWAFDSFVQTNIHQAMEDGGQFISRFNTPPFWPASSSMQATGPNSAQNPIILRDVKPTGPDQGFLIPQNPPSPKSTD